MSPAATLEQVAYGDNVANHGIEAWPAAGHALLDELRAARGRAALISAAAPVEADDLVDRLRTDLGVDVARLGHALASCTHLPTLADVESACAGATVITDLDVLMWPETHVSPLQFLSALARRHPTIAAWPGTISGGRGYYSAPGRPDHHDLALRDVAVLRPRYSRFPDEVPFTIERILP